MITKRAGRFSALALAAGVALAACSGGGAGGGGGGGGGGQAEGQPQRGGTLKYVGKSDVTSLDTAFSYYTVNYILMRGFTRQLVTYPATTNLDEAGKIVADMATEVPTRQNGGISADGLTYTFTIKQGVKWNTDPPRQVTAQDMERGIKRLCNPVAPSGALAYYTSTIQGMQQFCDGFAEVEGTAEAIASYIRNNDISGITQEGQRTVSFTLKSPTPDFLNIMAEYFATPAPEEYLQYVPNSAEFNQNVLSNGPYMVTKYEPNQEIVLERNPAWEPSTDDVRAAYVNRIHVQEGLTQQAAFQQVFTGAADVLWDVEPPTSRLPSLYGDERLEIIPAGTFNKYVVFNMVSPNANQATSKLKVRQAINYAVNKKAILQIYGGPRVGTVACQIMPDSSAGHIDNYQCPYATQNAEGNPQKAEQLLAQAGYPDGLTLKMLYRNKGNHPRVAQTLKQSLARAGITLQIRPVPADDFYSDYLQVADVARRGVWDLASPGWLPDWYGVNGRTYLQPLFYSANIQESDSSWGTNYGFYQSQRVNQLIQQATTAQSRQQAIKLFQQAQRQIMQDAAVVPVFWQKQPWLHSQRVNNYAGFPNYAGDITQIWLEQ